MAPQDEDELRHMARHRPRERPPRGAPIPSRQRLRCSDGGAAASPSGRKGRGVAHGTGWLVWAIGTMASEALRAAERLASERVSTSPVVNGPLREAAGHRVARRPDSPGSRLMTVEENALAGGFGSAVEETVMGAQGAGTSEIERLGIPDEFSRTGRRRSCAPASTSTSRDHAAAHGRFFPKDRGRPAAGFGRSTPPDAPHPNAPLPVPLCSGGDAMIHGRGCCGLPAYNAEKTLERDKLRDSA